MQHPFHSFLKLLEGGWGWGFPVVIEEPTIDFMSKSSQTLINQTTWYHKDLP